LSKSVIIQDIKSQKLIRESGFIPLERIFHQPDLTFRKIRAYSPWPGAWTKVEINHQSKRLKILKAHLRKERIDPRSGSIGREKLDYF